MKIILSNKLNYPKGGDCVYTRELEKLLVQNGHNVAVFSMDHPSNIESKYDKYFPSEVDYQNKSISNRVKQVSRMLNSKEVQSKFNLLIGEFKPDLLHVNNIHSQLSPIIVKLAHDKKIPTVWTLHDYKLLCPRYDCLLNGKPCELCFDSKINVIKNKCMKGSMSASVLAYAEALKWNKTDLETYTNAFICPSNFLKRKMVQGGFLEEKLHHLCNFINVEKTIHNDYSKKDYFCYVGRLSNEKGLPTLLEAFSKTNFKLKVIGSGPLESELKTLYKNENIEFVGRQTWENVKSLVSKAKFMILPSEWYENNPLSVIESLCLGTPVLGANIGGIPELINETKNGFLFESGNLEDLILKINMIENLPTTYFNYKKIANDSRERFSSKKYYDKLIEFYKNQIKIKQITK
jgi:glycosyltransferase involved in cell wall biosynthesis